MSHPSLTSASEAGEFLSIRPAAERAQPPLVFTATLATGFATGGLGLFGLALLAWETRLAVVTLGAEAELVWRRGLPPASAGARGRSSRPAAGRDPLELRRALLKHHPRHLGVLELAVQKAGWDVPLPRSRARGIAVYESFNSFVAQVAVPSTAPPTGVGEPGVPPIGPAVANAAR